MRPEERATGVPGASHSVPLASAQRPVHEGE